MKTSILLLVVLFVFVPLFIFAGSCDSGGNGGNGGNGEELDNTITFGGSEPGVAEGYYVFTFDDNGVPQSFELYWKMETGASADAQRIRDTITAWRSGTGFFDQIVAFKGERQDFFLADFNDPVPAFGTSSPDYETTTSTLTWSDSLLQEWTTTQDSVLISKHAYDYNVDDTLKANRRSSDGITFTEANWYQYGDPNFPHLPIEMRNFEGGDMPSDYDYANDPGGYKNGPIEMNDEKYTYTPNADGQIAEMVVQVGDGWAPSWTNSMKIVCTYDSSGRLSKMEQFIWSSGNWEQFRELPATYSGSVPSISMEELYFSPYFDYFFVVE
jgi:hypothetical protein